MTLPVVAVVGRPNVGKSTLVNRIIGRREAIVEERPGVTRDRKSVAAEWQGKQFTLVDTGGWMAGGTALDTKVATQAELAAQGADAVLFVVDATVGFTHDDQEVAQVLYPIEAPVIVVANKVDNASQADAIWELLGLGLGDPVAISALHGKGTGDLLDLLLDSINGSDATSAAAATSTSTNEGSVASPHREAPISTDFSVALVGRPNVGKSTLFNRLIGEDLSIVHDQPGTTRDSVDTVVNTQAGTIRFIDTAGMRRKARIDSGTEYYSLVRALRSVDQADVSLLVIDSAIGVTHQDQRLAERIDAAGSPIVVICNKWDILTTEAKEKIAESLEHKLSFIGGAPTLRMSALHGKNVDKLWPALQESLTAYRTRIPTRAVNEAIRAAQSAQPAPAGARILYATQGATDPPTFTLFVNRDLPRTYLRYIENQLRHAFDLTATSIKLRVRRR